VAFVVCNTDCKALEESPVPTKLQLGHEGLGAGNRPQKAREATEESLADIQEMLNDGTKMVFITAGMGGGTGTGAAPLIAKVAKDMDILTVGIVTIPFRWEGYKKIDQALEMLRTKSPEELKGKVSKVDRNELMRKLSELDAKKIKEMNIDTERLKKSLSGADLEKIRAVAGKDADVVMMKLKELLGG
jgi:hypothetical protein